MKFVCTNFVIQMALQNLLTLTIVLISKENNAQVIVNL